jgi:hypothetical protein
MSQQPETAPGEPGEPGTALTRFTPVPRATNRADGWTPEIQQRFIEGLADTGSVASACRMVGRSERSAYQLRRHPEGAEFAAAWLAAQGHGVLRLQDAVLERALNGVEVPLIYHGQVVGTARKYDDRLAAFILRNHLPAQYGEDGRRPHAIDRKKLERLKREWREEWEQERLAADQKEEAETLESLDAYFQGLRERRLANEALLAEQAVAEVGPRERAAWEEYQRIRAEERGEPIESGGAAGPEPEPGAEETVDGGELVPAPPPEGEDEGAAEPPPLQSTPARWNPAHGPPPWAQRKW